MGEELCEKQVRGRWAEVAREVCGNQARGGFAQIRRGGSCRAEGARVYLQLERTLLQI